MKNSNKKLQEYFNAAKAQKLPLQLDDLKKDLVQAGNPPAPRPEAANTTFSVPKTATLSAGLLVVIIALVTGLWFILPGEETDQTREVPGQHQASSGRQPEKKPAAKEPAGKSGTAPVAENAPLATQPKLLTENPLSVRRKKQTRPIATPSVETDITGNRLINPFWFVELPLPVLEQLGFEVGEKGIHYEMMLRFGSDPVQVWIHISENKSEIGAWIDTPPAGTSLRDSTGTSPKPIFISDRKGQQQLAGYRTPEEDPRKLEPGYFNEVINSLVPVLITAPNATKDEAVFWFKPTPEFLKVLPEAIAQEIAAEYQLLSQEKKPEVPDSKNNLKNAKTDPKAAPPTDSANASVAQRRAAKEGYKYFEASGAGISTARQVDLFPNPAQDKISIALNLEMPHKLRISLTDISGRVIKMLNPLQGMTAGQLLHTYSVKDVPPGIYVLVIESASGEKQTQRLIIQ